MSPEEAKRGRRIVRIDGGAAYPGTLTHSSDGGLTWTVRWDDGLEDDREYPASELVPLR